MTQKFSFFHWLVFFVALLALILSISVFFRDNSNSPNINNRSIADNASGQQLTKKHKAAPPSYQRSIVAQSCPSDHFVTGIDANGKIKCATISTIRFSQRSQKLECHGHGYISDGFCSCDEEWTGPECETRKEPPKEGAPADNDFDNFPATVDCNDYDDMVYPGAPDIDDGKDNDCDGEIDEGY